MLKIENVSKKLGNKIVLNNCSLTLEKGSVLGLIGPNGAGKSTLLSIIAGLEDYKGKIIAFNEG